MVYLDSEVLWPALQVSLYQPASQLEISLTSPGGYNIKLEGGVMKSSYKLGL